MGPVVFTRLEQRRKDALVKRNEDVGIAEEARHVDEQIVMQRVQLVRVLAKPTEVRVALRRAHEGHPARDPAPQRRRLAMGDVHGGPHLQQMDDLPKRAVVVCANLPRFDGPGASHERAARSAAIPRARGSGPRRPPRWRCAASPRAPPSRAPGRTSCRPLPGSPSTPACRRIPCPTGRRRSRSPSARWRDRMNVSIGIGGLADSSRRCTRRRSPSSTSAVLGGMTCTCPAAIRIPSCTSTTLSGEAARSAAVSRLSCDGDRCWMTTTATFASFESARGAASAPRVRPRSRRPRRAAYARRPDGQAMPHPPGR